MMKIEEAKNIPKITYWPSHMIELRGRGNNIEPISRGPYFYKFYDLLMVLYDRQGVIGGGGGSTPHGIILAVVVALVVFVPFFLGDGGEAITEGIAELLSPVGLLLLPIVLLLTIQFLSSERGSFVSAIFSTGEPESIHRVSGSPVGVALFLVLILFLLYNRFSIFGGGDDSDD
ncbi:hypothetical protein YC2023_029816 [Brassica napus]